MKDFFTTEIRYDEAREGPDFTCDACAEVRCATCDHEPCPACIDSCDHTACTTWNDKGEGMPNHECQFTACSRLHSPEPLEYEARKARALDFKGQKLTALRQRILDETLVKRSVTPDKLLEFAGVWQREGLPEEAERIRLHAKRLEKDSLETT